MIERRVTVAAILAVTAGCSSLQPVAEPLRFIAETNPPVVYVSYETGAVMVMENPRISGDSMLGTVPGESRPVALPLNQVQTVSTVRRNSGRTALLIAGLAGMGAVMTYAVLANGTNSNYTCDYNDPKRTGGPACGFEP